MNVYQDLHNKVSYSLIMCTFSPFNLVIESQKMHVSLSCLMEITIPRWSAGCIHFKDFQTTLIHSLKVVQAHTLKGGIFYSKRRESQLYSHGLADEAMHYIFYISISFSILGVIFSLLFISSISQALEKETAFLWIWRWHHYRDIHIVCFYNGLTVYLLR